MRDLLFVVLTVGFFSLASLYLRGCAVLAGDRRDDVIRADDLDAPDPERPQPDEEVAR